MMRNFALVLIVLASCNLPGNKTKIENSEKSSIEQEKKNIPENKLSVIVYDGCECIIYKENKDLSIQRTC